MINILKKIFCKHRRVELNRWHRCHGPNGNDPLIIEAEYICRDCGKVVYKDDSIKFLRAYEAICKEYERRIK